MTVAIGKKAPDFTAPTDGGGTLKLSDFKGQKVVLYFYPKDDTSGCTAQACAFTENMSAFNKVKAKVIGVSKDSVKKHDKFVEKYCLKFPLVSDEDSDICETYGVWVEKSMYGKKYMGIERTTFLIDENGKIAHIWNKVKVPGHADEVIAKIKEI
jgi:peroxiredoxin Q/BCP